MPKNEEEVYHGKELSRVQKLESVGEVNIG